jgi:hypothetical protein
VVVKLPKWPFDKFQGASRKLGSQMKATGEVMSIAHSFEAALMKAVRGAEIGLDTLTKPASSPLSLERHKSHGQPENFLCIRGNQVRQEQRREYTGLLKSTMVFGQS